MSDWRRSIIALGTAFAGVVLLTLGIAGLLVPQHRSISGEPQASGATDQPRAVGEEGRPTIPSLGGELTVTGDRPGTLVVNRYAVGTRFGISGDDGEIYFGTDPFGVAQLNYDGLSFFPDEGDCTITPGNSANAVGVGSAELRCEEIADVRGGGVVTIAGTIGLPVDVLAGMNLPSSGGRLDVGGETWSFDDAELATWQMGMRAGQTEYQMKLVDDDGRGTLNFTFDVNARSVTLANVRRGEDNENVPEGSCQLRSAELGTRDIRTTVLELSIDCTGVTVPGMGEVSISGTVVVDRLEFPA